MNTLVIILVAFAGWAAAAFGWIKWLHELREKRAERAAKEKAEAEIREIQRRSAELRPYFDLSDSRFNSVTTPGDRPGQLLGLYPGRKNLLCFLSNEVDKHFKAGEPIYLLVENHGSNAFEITMNLEGGPVQMIKVKTDHGVPLLAVKYPYRPDHHGREETLEVRFLAFDGIRDVHRYVTRHGFRALKRIDPA